MKCDRFGLAWALAVVWSGVWGASCGDLEQGAAPAGALREVTQALDSDGDGLEDGEDNCPGVANNGFVDSGLRLGSSPSRDVALGDLDGDGDLDAFVVNDADVIGAASANRVWLGDGQGGFVDSGQALGVSRSLAVRLGDIDGDGDLDALVINYAVGATNTVWFNDGLGGFTDSGQQLGEGRSRDARLKDLDGDGDLDAFVVFDDRGDRVWFNDGLGGFTDSGQSLGNTVSRDVHLVDVDGDGDEDAFVVNQHQPNRVWLNDGAGRFSDSGQNLGFAYSESVRFGDLDGDGDQDAFVANYLNEPNQIWLNDGAGRFSAGSSYGTSSSMVVELGDVDGDGDLDGVVANDGSPDEVWLGDGAGRFTRSVVSGSLSASPLRTFDIALGDFDGDGDLDAFTVSFNFMNNAPTTNRVWLNTGGAQLDNDGDGAGDRCDDDDDDDGVLDADDAFPLDPTESADSDGDRVGDNADNCPDDPNPNQEDIDTNGVGDACEVDLGAPLVLWGGERAPDTTGVPAPVEREDGFSLAELTVFDSGVSGQGGLASVTLVLNGVQTILSATFDPTTRAPQVGFRCTPGACQGESLFLYGGPPGQPLRDGDHCAQLTATDAAGNTTTQDLCWRLGDATPDLAQLQASGQAICARVDDEVGAWLDDPDPEVAAAALKARATCADKGLTCLNSAPEPQLGCHLLALVGTHKLLLNVERLADAEATHEALRGAIVGHARRVLEHVQGTWPVTRPDSAQLGADVLDGIDGAGTAAMSQIEEAFFWFDDARRPYPQLNGQGDACLALEDLSAEFASYGADGALPAFDGVLDARATLEEARALLCRVDLGPGAPCYDRGFLVGLTRLMDAAGALKQLRDPPATTGDDGTLVWTRNWQLGVSRVAQLWLNLALDNFGLWAQAGGVAPGYEALQAEASASWGDAEALLEAGDLERFIFQFTDPAARCLMYETFEYVHDWWEDASNPTCGRVRYPDVCFDAEGDNEWPLHQVQTAGD